MTWLAGPTVLLVVTLCVSSAQDNATVWLNYPRRMITTHRGSSVKLSCDAIYNLKRCGLVHVEWCNFTKKCAKLTDSSRYFTTVNETAVDENTRRRQVVTEILNVTTEDDGQFQCNAHCEGESALGHYIIVKVEG
ncbi:uncharacterized protein zgc:174945 [Lates japonicus]|uniref:Immunoglobulin domain-containing protein n=1 Tax=Lates japonicus TaxID=270547 RepID=A0AAD3R302_LATJO|nr:uncharacterized protein AKAME5_000601700 [Lates japonicus]